MKKLLSLKNRSELRSNATPGRIVHVLTVLCLLSSTFLMAKPSLATCKESKPKDWSTGTAIATPTAPTPAPTPIIVCINQSTTVSASGTDNDHWEIRCKADNKLESSGDTADTLTYSWTGTGTFANATSASTSWTAPATAGEVELTCTLDDVPTTIPAGETGSRDDGSVTTKVKICVVDPGTPPTAVAKVDYKETIVAPSGTDWGLMTPSHATLDITAYFDCTSKTWKCSVTKAESKYDIFYRLITGVDEASEAAATATNYCDMIHDLSTLIRTVPATRRGWFMVSAVEAHERQHVKEWKSVQDSTFAAAKTTIEGLTVAHECGRTAAQATALIKAKPAYAKAISDMQADTNTQWTPFTTPDPNARVDAAEHGVVDGEVAKIKAKAAATQTTATPWPACGP
jgi:hypothetical protein